LDLSKLVVMVGAGTRQVEHELIARHDHHMAGNNRLWLWRPVNS
jgi:hypothetical protein